MKYFFALILSFFLVVTTSFSQGKTIMHKVVAGETVIQIAKKYQVTPYDIYELNPDAQRGIQPDVFLLIPNKGGYKASTSATAKAVTPATAVPATNQSKFNLKTTSHEVLPKETMYGISKMYNITAEELTKANPFLATDGVQIGQVLVVPSKTSKAPASAPAKSYVAPEKTVYHEVQRRETKYSIAKQYGITIAELEKRNPEIIPNLTKGYKLLIKGSRPKEVDNVPSVGLKQENTVLTPSSNVKTLVEYTSYEVKPQETLYSLSKKFNLTQEQLIALNPDLNNGVNIGAILKVPANTITKFQNKKEFGSLSKMIAEGKRKRLVLLLPFNIPHVEGDSENSIQSRLKKDKFLDMTMDFYSGALMAIDSAKVLGLPIDVEIYDSEENKNGSDVAKLISQHNLQAANAIIGPFYQSNAEVAAQILATSNTPVISPLSKDVGNPMRNLFQTIPSQETVKNTMFDYMRANRGNIMAVVDKKKTSIIDYIKENQKGVPFVAFTDKGSVSVESFKSLLVKGKMNYVVMETGNTWMIKSTISMMIGVMKDYQVQLVILEPNDTLNFEEIKIDNLVKLKLMYPSVTRENISPEAMAFDRNYKQLNNVFPDTYSTRGFDVTFDTMMRLVQDVKFEDTVNSVATKQIDNQFEYYRKSDGGYTNKGVFILYYDTDLTIKEAN
ncbi:LysM peptidoglycan-binding domain-containing protein [Flavobacterium algicola]|uniref:LysM peptidoglycan-binding domain-containing protein n=1 Tax=Flavobacterium algicola TaxID=556529 RepID=UPI001EFCF4BD|nr:LysM peptidoglycan-binding domain-containing protein [Flavobacterium algicola]MCG9793822.1 LysM peptidoglycan-binding domain-containing protein [Flavobacterium algicola]